MVVLSDKPIKAKGSFNVPLLELKPFWVLEYVSRESKRKDYDESFQKYAMIAALAANSINRAAVI